MKEELITVSIKFKPGSTYQQMIQKKLLSMMLTCWALYANNSHKSSQAGFEIKEND